MTSPLVAPTFELWHRPQACLRRREPVLGPARADQRREVASASVARPRVPPPPGARPRADENGSSGGRSPSPLPPVLGFLYRREPVLGLARVDPVEGGRLRRCHPFSGSSAAERPAPGPVSADPAEGGRLCHREPVLRPPPSGAMSGSGRRCAPRIWHR
jgi:hypothetical protein